MTIDWSFEKMFAELGLVRMGFGILFALFLLLFVIIAIEEVFLGGRRRRQAEKKARLAHDAATRPED